MKTLKVKHDLNVQFERTYRDRITGFEGKCTGTCKYISGCDQVLLQAPAKDGKTGEAAWFDDERLIDVNGTPVKRTSRRGGPQDHPAPIR